MANETILYLTHTMNQWVREEFDKLSQTSGNKKTVLLFQGDDKRDLPEPNFCVPDDKLWSLDYPIMGDKLVPGHVHFPFFHYFKKNSEADYYWLIENDVRFTGEWNYFFDYFKKSNADLVTSLIRTYHEYPEWDWWELKHPDKEIRKEERITSFNPVYRISRSGARFLDHAFESGWQGHNEVSFPTLLNHNGFELQDFGGSGKFVRGKKNKFYTNYPFLNHLYTSGTFRYRPIRDRAGYCRKKLYHPVKPSVDKGLLYNLRYLKHRIHKRQKDSKANRL